MGGFDSIFELEDKFELNSPFNDWVSDERLLKNERLKKQLKDRKTISGSNLSSSNITKSDTKIRIMSSALNSKGNPLEYDSNGNLKKGQNRMYLFTVTTKDEYEGEMDSKRFLSTYQMIYNDSFPVSSFSFTINGIAQSLKPFAKFSSINNNKDLLAKAMYLTSLKDINSFLNKAQKEFPNGLSILQKLLYWNHEKKYDYKSSQAKGYPLIYIKDIGVMEADHIGNIIYGNVMGSPYAQSFQDGDFLQKNLKTSFGLLNSIDDPYDSYSLAIGSTSGVKLTADDFIRIFSFSKSVQISKYNVKTYNYQMDYFNHKKERLIYNKSFSIYGD